MSEHFEYRLEKWEKCVVFQVTKQSEEFTAFIDSDDGLYLEISGISVEIQTVSLIDISISPCSPKMTIYLRGDDKYRDFNACCEVFENNECRDKFYNIINIALNSAIESFEESLKGHE